jgi:hypothetical protein
MGAEPGHRDMSGDSHVEVQVAEFFAERGLLPLVWAGWDRREGWRKVHGAYPASPLAPVCGRKATMRPATLGDLLGPPCRRCIKTYIWHRRRPLAEVDWS